MKKALIVVAIVVLLPVLALTIFIATFDADRYRPLITQKIAEATGLPVDIGRLSLGWRNGLALELGGVVLYSDTERRLPPGLKVQSASVLVRLLPLLQKDVEVGSIRVTRPQLMLEKHPDGSLWLGGLNLSKPAAPSREDKAAAGALALSIDSIVVSDGEVNYVDRSAAQPLVLEVRDLDVRVDRFSLFKPFSFDVRAAVFGDRQNVRASGRLALPQPQKPGSADDISVEVDLGGVNLRRLHAAVPSTAQLRELAGRLNVSVKHADLSPSAGRAEAKLSLEQGRVLLQGVASPIEDIRASATLKDEHLKIENLSAAFAGGKLGVTADVHGLRTQPVTDMNAAVRDLELQQLVQSVAPNAPTLTGHLSADLSGRANGFTWPEISRTLNGQARLILKDGVLLNFNILREVVQKLSIIPGAERQLQTNFPQAYRSAMAERSTVLHPLDLQAAIRNGVLYFDPMAVQTDFLRIVGAGQVGLDRSIRLNTMLAMHRELSAALAAIVPPLQYMLNARGEIELPMQVQGTVPQVAVIPDVQYLTSKVVAANAQEVLGSIASGKDPKESLEAALGGFLKNTAAAQDP